MSLHTQTARRASLATYKKNECPQCGEWLLAPDWSEYLDTRCVRHNWSCESCDYQFETVVYFAKVEAKIAAEAEAA
jgi:ribosomal protein L37AE/L43A